MPDLKQALRGGAARQARLNLPVYQCCATVEAVLLAGHVHNCAHVRATGRVCAVIMVLQRLAVVL